MFLLQKKLDWVNELFEKGKIGIEEYFYLENEILKRKKIYTICLN